MENDSRGFRQGKPMGSVFWSILRKFRTTGLRCPAAARSNRQSPRFARIVHWLYLIDYGPVKAAARHRPRPITCLRLLN